MYFSTTDRGPARYNLAAGVTEWDEYRRTPGLTEVRHVTATEWATQPEPAPEPANP